MGGREPRMSIVIQALLGDHEIYKMDTRTQFLCRERTNENVTNARIHQRIESRK